MEAVALIVIAIASYYAGRIRTLVQLGQLKKSGRIKVQTA